MRPTTSAIVIAGIALVSGLLLQQPERAAADYNITGEWVIELGDGSQIPMTATQTKPVPFSGIYTVECVLTLGSSPNTTTYTLTGAYDPASGAITCSGTLALDGSVSAGGHAMQGTLSTSFGQPSPFNATGGAGDPKFHLTSPAVSGVSFDVPSSDGSTFDAWWLAAMAAFVALGGVMFAVRRG
jgi:hypothetical protein